MKTTFSMLLIFFGLTLFSAQNTFRIQGLVYDFHDKTALGNARIKVGNHTASSDSQGKFSLNNVTQGTYLLTVTHPECTPFSENITVDRDLQLTINLEHHEQEIQEVIIQGGHKSTGSLIVQTLEKEEISRNSTENLGNLLSRISGVGALKTGNNVTKPVIHGLYGSRISILNNGVKMAEQEWGVEHAPNVDINAFEHIDVVKGASALKYGSDAIGGVIVLQSEIYKKADTLKGHLNLSGISNGRGLGFVAHIVKTWQNSWFVSVNGGYKKLGDLHSPDYNLWNTGLNSNSFNFSAGKNDFMNGFNVNYAFTSQEIGIYRGSHIGNLEDFYQVLNSDEPVYKRDFSYEVDNPKQDIQHHLAKISGYKRYENIGKISADFSFQYNHRKEFDIRREEFSDTPSLDLELFTNHFNLNHFIEREKWNLESGIDLMYQYNYSTSETMARRLVPNYHKYSGGIYSVLKYKLTPDFQFETGVRYDYTQYKVKMWYDVQDWESRYAAQFSQFYQFQTDGGRVFTVPVLNFNNLSLNAGMEYSPSRFFNVKANYAKVGRTPNIAELFSNGLHHSAAVIEVGDMRLENETGHQFNMNLSSELDVLHGLQVSLNPYLFVSKNFINQVPAGIQSTIRGIFPVWNYEQIKAKMFGVDFDVDLQLSNAFRYKGNFAYVYGQDETSNQPLIMMLPPNFFNTLEFKNREWNNLYFSVSNHTFLQQKRFPIYNPEVLLIENGVEVSRLVDLSTPPKGYTLWDLQTGLQFSRNFSAGLTVSNVFNTKYRDYLNRMRFFSQESGRNVVLNVKYNF